MDAKQKIFLAELLRTHDDDYFAAKYLSANAWIFSSQDPSKSSADYGKFKSVVAAALGLTSTNVLIVGSAKTRFSLNPAKEFKEFRLASRGETLASDVDIAMISAGVFDSIWDDVLRHEYSTGVPEKPEIRKSVFRRFVSVDLEHRIVAVPNAVKHYPDFVSWVTKMDQAKRDIQITFKISNDINYRVYRNWKDFREYHLSGIRRLKLQYSK